MRPARIRRLIDPHRPAKLPALEAALAALGLSLVAEAVPRAQHVEYTLAQPTI
ncbi:hypothetical protein [Candidatus Poriferisodalis sp.]|uniref:hypothetical protein n=1 Tax=Candidatus Poriferisodalis sp. TaxID=3101277 RepID=UPI003AF60F41